jgi:hydrogenase maturation protease
MSGASTAERAATTIVVGIGNPLLGDDGVGWRVADAVQGALAGREGVTVDSLAVGGLTLMERLVGWDRAILVDAVVTGHDPVGTVRRHDLATLPARAGGHLDSAHDVTLQGALDVGRALGAALPRDITVVTIEAASVGVFSEALTPSVSAAVPAAVERVLAAVDGR